MGLGYWTRSSCEFLLMGKRGDIGKFRGPHRDIY